MAHKSSPLLLQRALGRMRSVASFVKRAMGGASVVAPTPAPPYRHFVLEPVEPPIVSAYVPLFGWMVADSKPRTIDVTVFAKPFPYELHPRIDIADTHPGKYTTGLYAIVSLDRFLHEIAQTRALPFAIRMDGDTLVSETVPVAPEALQLAARSTVNKQAKREFLRRSVQCPQCAMPLTVPASADLLVCGTCRAEYPQKTAALNLVAGPSFTVQRALPTSLGKYSEYERDVIDEARRRGGYVLDFGAGLRESNEESVINLEIADYPTTDVISTAERLPFASETFDAVISLHVLEHLPRPWRMAEEMKRVLKPGGVALCTVPFVSPEHGFPDHFYNMTRSGLKNLFEGMRVEKHFVKGDGHPINGVQQLLSTYYGNLEEPYRAAFGAVRIRDIVGTRLPELLTRDYATHLPDHARWKLAAHTTVLMRK